MAPRTPFGERFELDAAPLVEPVRRIDQTQHAVLNRSPTSIEFGIDAAMRRASASTKGRLATIRWF
jgi:hypothetical protein